MKQYITKFVTFLTSAAFLAMPLLASAAGVPIPPDSVKPTTLPTFFAGCQNVGCFAGKLVEVGLAIVFAVAVIYLVIGGFRYIISQGNEEGVEKAKGTITNALIGLVIVVLAWIILTVVVNILNSTGTSGGNV